MSESQTSFRSVIYCYHVPSAIQNFLVSMQDKFLDIHMMVTKWRLLLTGKKQ